MVGGRTGSHRHGNVQFERGRQDARDYREPTASRQPLERIGAIGDRRGLDAENHADPIGGRYGVNFRRRHSFDETWDCEIRSKKPAKTRSLLQLGSLAIKAKGSSSDNQVWGINRGTPQSVSICDTDCWLFWACTGLSAPETVPNGENTANWPKEC